MERETDEDPDLEDWFVEPVAADEREPEEDGLEDLTVFASWMSRMSFAFVTRDWEFALRTVNERSGYCVP